MSFLKSVGKVAADAGKTYVDTMKREMEKIEEYIYRFEDLSDEELFKKMRTSSNREMKLACQKILSDRGYGK